MLDRAVVVFFVCVISLLFCPQGAMAQTAQSSAKVNLPVNKNLPSCGVVTKRVFPVPNYDNINDITYISGKLGYEDHLTSTQPSHYVGSDSNPLKFAGDGAYSPHTTNRERYYINSQWKGFDWQPTLKKGVGPRLIYTKKASYIRSVTPHLRLIIKSTETGRTMAVSVEESGPAMWVTKRDGINFGAPPEVYHYLGGSSPYTADPNDGKGKIKVLGFINDNYKNNILGPCTYE